MSIHPLETYIFHSKEIFLNYFFDYFFPSSSIISHSRTLDLNVGSPKFIFLISYFSVLFSIFLSFFLFLIDFLNLIFQTFCCVFEFLLSYFNFQELFFVLQFFLLTILFLIVSLSSLNSLKILIINYLSFISPALSLYSPSFFFLFICFDLYHLCVRFSDV